MNKLWLFLAAGILGSLYFFQSSFKVNNHQPKGKRSFPQVSQPVFIPKSLNSPNFQFQNDSRVQAQSVKLQASTKKDTILPLQQLYQNFTYSQKIEFIQQQSKRISRMISSHEENLTQIEYETIKLYLDSYAQRIDTNHHQIWKDSMNQKLQQVAYTFAPHIIEVFEKEKLPPQIGLYLAMIESEFHECLTSPAGAKGMFQFMPATAAQYGLDPKDRCDWKKSASAAARYMKDRIFQFGVDGGSVTLALAGYNRGPQSVMRDMSKVLENNDSVRTFWTLAREKKSLDKYFQNENSKYVPKFFAAAILGENPWAFGIPLAALSTYRHSPAEPKLHFSAQ